MYNDMSPQSNNYCLEGFKADLLRSHSSLKQIQQDLNSYQQSLAPTSKQISNLLIEIVSIHIEAYQRLLEIDPEKWELWFQLGNILAKQNQTESAISSYCRAKEINPDNYELHHNLGDLFTQQENWDEAISCYQRAVELNPTSFLCYHKLAESIYQRVMVNPESYFNDYKLGELAHQKYQIVGGPLPEVCFLNDEDFSQVTSHLDDESYVVEMYRVYVRRSLTKAEKFEQVCLKWLRSPGSSRPFAIQVWRKSLPEFHALLKSSVLSVCLQQAIECYRHALELNQNHYQSHYGLGEALVRQGKSNESITVYHNLAILLAEKGLIGEAVAVFQKAMQAHNSYDMIWKGLNQFIPMDQANSCYTSDFDQATVSEYFHKTSQYTVMNMWAFTEADKIFLEQAGLSLANLELITQDSLPLEEIYINSFDPDNQTQLAKKTLKTANYQFAYAPHLNQPNNYQQSMVETGYIYAVCPVSGKILKTNQSFYDVAWLPMMSYRFVGSEIFYLIVGHFWGAKMCLYFPRLELIIQLSPSATDCENVINRLKSNMVTHWKEVKIYIDNHSKEVGAILGSISNMAHYVWNELTGIYYLHENDLLSKISHVLIEPNEYYNFGGIFPELSDKTSRFPDKLRVFQEILSNNYCAVRVTNVVIKEQLATRIVKGCMKNCSSVFLEEVEQAKKHFPLLWFGIRNGNRIWVSQVEGIANIIKALDSDFPNLGIVFDGYSRTEIEDAHTASMIEKDKATQDQILGLLPPHINTYTTIGSMTYEKVIWADAIDIYVIPLSSGNTAVSSIVNKPGIMHANTGFCNDGLREQMLYHRENAIPPVFIPLEYIVDQDATPHLLSVNCQNYDCDWTVIYNEVVKILQNLQKNR